MASRVGGNTKGASVAFTGASQAKLNLSHIIQVLPDLTKQDLKTLQAAVDAELSKNITIDTDLFYMVFDVANEKPMSVSKFSSSENGTVWRKNQPIFDEFFDKFLQGAKREKVFVRAVKKLFVNLIVEDIQNSSYKTLTLRQICHQLGHIEVVVERAFPGYMKNNMSRVILEQLGGKYE